MATIFREPSLNIEQQIELLRDRKGLVIPNIESAKHFLCHVSYFRFKLYTKHFLDETGKFNKEITFDDIVNLYLFDKNLKIILFSAIETIEIAIKTIVSNKMCSKYGTHWFMHQQYFLAPIDKYDPKTGELRYKKFIFNDFIEFLRTNCTIDSEEYFISGYKRAYNDPEFPPSWMIMEILTFGTISKIFEHINDSEIKSEICQHFGSAKNLLTSWLHCFNELRNICAHHSKLVYRFITFKPVLPSKQSLRFLENMDGLENRKLYSALCCIQFLLKKIDPNSQFSGELIKLIDANPTINLDALGFIAGWQKEVIWK